MNVTAKRLTGLSLGEQRPAFLVAFGHGATHWILATYYLIMPFARDDLGLSLLQYGLLGAVIQLSSAAANLGSGLVVDLTGRTVVFQVIALLAGGAAFAGFALHPTFPLLLALVAVIGAASNLWHPAGIALLSKMFPRNKGYALSIHVFGASAADAMAPLAAGALIGLVAWQGTALVGALPAFVGAAIIAAALLAGDRPEDGAPRRTATFAQYLAGLKDLVRDRAVISLCAVSGFRNVVVNGLYVFLPLYLVQTLGFPALWTGLALVVLQLGGLIGTPIAGIASDRVSRRAIMIAAMTFSTAVLAVLTLVRDSVVLVGGISVLGFLLFSMRPVIQSWMMDLTPPSTRGTATSLLFGAQSALSAIGIFAGGVIAERWGLHAVFAMLAGSILIANLLVFLLPRRTGPAE